MLRTNWCSCELQHLSRLERSLREAILGKTSMRFDRVCYFSVWYFVVSVSVNASLWFDIVKCRCRQCTRTNLFTNHWLPQKLKLWCVRLSNDELLDLTSNLSYCGFGYPNHYSTTAVFWSISQGIEMWTQTLPAPSIGVPIWSSIHSKRIRNKEMEGFCRF